MQNAWLERPVQSQRDSFTGMTHKRLPIRITKGGKLRGKKVSASSENDMCFAGTWLKNGGDGERLKETDQTHVTVPGDGYDMKFHADFPPGSNGRTVLMLSRAVRGLANINSVRREDIRTAYLMRDDGWSWKLPTYGNCDRSDRLPEDASHLFYDLVNSKRAPYPRHLPYYCTLYASLIQW